MARLPTQINERDATKPVQRLTELMLRDDLVLKSDTAPNSTQRNAGNVRWHASTVGNFQYLFRASLILGSGGFRANMVPKAITEHPSKQLSSVCWVHEVYDGAYIGYMSASSICKCYVTSRIWE